MRRFAFIVVLLTAVSVFSQPTGVGEVAFASSGSAEAQPAFLRGLALLHNFEYPAAAEMFRKAQELDPSFAMAYWGEAMTYTHPVWFQQDAGAARAALARLGATPAERLGKAPTEREKDYLRAADVLYGEGAKNDRDFLFADAMAALHARYPNDVDATAFYALALLGTAHEGRDFAIYMRAAALLEDVFPTHLHHPGVLHYLIHSYDDPMHAPLGMRAARLYGAVAPDAGHALHMTSHIFIAMGMWDDVIDANRRAIAVVNQQRAARSKPKGDCGHYPIWLHYALLQKGSFAEARQSLDACRASAFAPKFESAGAMDTLQGRLDSYAEMRAAQVAAGQPLTAADAVVIPDGVDAPGARFTLAYGDVLAAAQSGDANALKAATARLHALHDDVAAAAAKETNPTSRIRADVMVQEADAFQLAAAGRREDALKILADAAKAEQSMPLEFGPPVFPKPAAELLGDQLLAAGRAAEAAAAYQLVLDRAPGRTHATQMLARARKSAGAASVAEQAPAVPHVH
jgi:tetratricopeptide (TPR) repeat protein